VTSGPLEFWRIFFAKLPGFLPYLLRGALVTVEITFASLAVAIVFGLVLALLRHARVPLFSALASVYIELLRAVPVLTTLFIIYFGFAYAGIRLSSFAAAVAGLGMLGAAYMAEIHRAGIESVHRGQREAALSLGMTPTRAMRYVVLPQAFRVVIPPTANYAIGLLKDTAVVSTVAAPELLFAAKTLVSQTILPMQVYLLAALMYLALSLPLARLAQLVEVRLGRGV
jgi:polar amino acid transport system permease protein/cystine transport system permease protein